MSAIDLVTDDEGDWLARTRVKMIDNLKIALETSNKALTNEKQKNVNDRKMYDIQISKFKKHFTQKLQEYRVSYRVATHHHQSQAGQVALQSQQSTHLPRVDQSVQTLHALFE